MDRTYIDKHLAIDRYLQGKLTDPEVAEFEERLVWDRELQDELDLAEALQSGLRASAGVGDYTTGTYNGGPVRRLWSTLSMPRYAAAASFLLGVFLASMLAEDPPAGSGIEGPTTVMPLVALRSTDVQTVPVDPDGMTVLMVDVPPGYVRFRVSIRREGVDEPFWTRTDLEPGYTEALAIGLPGRELAPASYRLTVEGVTDGTATLVQEVSFRTVTSD